MIIVQISGNPATGKTFGAKFLEPEKTYIIDADKKGLPWKGWRQSYSVAKKNYAPVSDVPTMVQIVSKIVAERKEITSIVIDTVNSAMTDKEIAESKKIGFDIHLSNKKPFNCWNILKAATLQNNLEIWVSLNV